jgi:hypothetical protein
MNLDMKLNELVLNLSLCLFLKSCKYKMKINELIYMHGLTQSGAFERQNTGLLQTVKYAKLIKSQM